MQTGYILCFFIFPMSLEGCCVGNRQKTRTGHQQNITHQYYRAVEEEIFMMPCVNRHMQVVWSRTTEVKEQNERPSFDCGRQFPAEAKHSGTYTCLTCGSRLFFHLQVVESTSLGCFQAERSEILLVGVGGIVSCPGVTCSNNTDVIWYKGNKSISEQRRRSCESDGRLHLCQVSHYDTGVYFCDRQIIEHGVNWTFRRAVNVRVVPHHKPSSSPTIIYPQGNRKEEVELGQPHTLICEVQIPFEINFSPEVQWYMHYGGNMENTTQLPMECQVFACLKQERVKFEVFKVTQRAFIKEVTPQHLNSTYTCIASNTVGNNSVTIKLKKKVKWPSLVAYTIMSFLLVTGLGIIVHVKWLELQLIYRSNFQHGKHDGDEKRFDVLLSYVWSPTSAEEEGVLTLSSQSGPDADEEACLSSMAPLNSEGKATQRPLEVLLPRVLEERWGYRLCLLERDVLPGGAFTNDVVLAIQRSQMLICVLSADYLSNSNAVFVLESGVQALLQNSNLKLLLIWTSRASASIIQPDPPLPTLVQRALKVLPSLDWTSCKSARATSNFWRSLRKAMPDHRVKLVSLMQDQ